MFMPREEQHTPRHAAPGSSEESEVVHLGLCDPSMICTPEERAELDRDIGELILRRRLAEAQAPFINLD